MIEVEGLEKYYGERKVLHDLCFSIKPGRVCGLLGPNGSGKTTTMDILAGLLGPSGGSVRICGHDVVAEPQKVKEKIGYLPDNPPLHKEMTVHDFVTYVAKLQKVPSSTLKQAVEDVMQLCDVTEVAHRVIGHLSKGFRQRVGLCAALVHDPQVLILDEPTEGLDPSQILHIRNLIKKLAPQRTVLLSSHILSEVQSTCDEAIIIHKGCIASKLSLRDTVFHHKTYVYTFAEKMELAVQWLSQSPLVLRVKDIFPEQNAVVVEFPEEAHPAFAKHLAELTSQLVSQGFPVIGIWEKKEGLEEIFFDVIRSRPSPIQNENVRQKGFA